MISLLFPPCSHLFFVLMGKSWYRSTEQDSYLQEQVKELLKARLDETVKGFRHQLYETWEAHWPEVKVLFPNQTDADPPLTKEQIDKLANAMATRKKVSLIAILFVALVILVLRFILSKYIPASAGLLVRNPSALGTQKPCSLAIFARSNPSRTRRQRASGRCLPSTATFTTKRLSNRW